MVLENSRLFATLIAGLWNDDPLVRMRAADAAEKVTRQMPELLVPHKKELLGLMAEADQAELRWHLSVLAPRLPLNSKELELVSSLLKSYLQDRHSIVKTLALQGLADLAQTEPSIRVEVKEILQQACRTGTAAMKARSRKLLKSLVI